MRRLIVVALVLVAGAACSGDGGDGAPGAPSAPSATSTSAPTAASGAGTAAPGPTEPPPAAPGLRVVSLNVLHGLFCEPATDFCDAPNRVALLLGLLEDAGCPELVGLQEIGPRQEELIVPALAGLCEGAYELVWNPEPGPDREMVLTSLPVLDERFVDLAGFPWSAHWVRVESPAGPVDFLTTHFASSANNPPCGPETCPPLCPVGVETGTCHALEVVDFLDRYADPDGITVVAGDLNQPVDHPRIRTLLDAGFVDVWTAAGNPECDPATGEGCTCCLDDESDPGVFSGTEAAYDERIDFVLVRVPARCELVLDPPGDADGDGVGTGRFAGTPVADGPGGLTFPSDHAGVQADLACA
ncbi:MAG: endonuclease/exonuclease/phosphatase family protein [Acidimicrobiia bacterium]|nr:endonuclease/exonuclease/phosphatase family protein [Acidimicrobiia bacterium]